VTAQESAARLEASMGAKNTLMALTVMDASGPELLALMSEQSSDFCRQPRLAMGCRETGPLAYMQQHPLIVEMSGQNEEKGGEPQGLLLCYVARLLYLASLIDTQKILAPQGMAGMIDNAIDGTTKGGGYRLSWVNSVRGLLLHCAALEGGAGPELPHLCPDRMELSPRWCDELVISGTGGRF